MMSVERVGFRYTVGMIAVLGGIIGLVGLYYVEVPVGNRDAVMLALGIVLGWGSTVMNGEWGSSPAGRKAADVGVRLAEVAAPETPQEVTVVNEPDEPVPTTTRKAKP